MLSTPGFLFCNQSKIVFIDWQLISIQKSHVDIQRPFYITVYLQQPFKIQSESKLIYVFCCYASKLWRGSSVRAPAAADVPAHQRWLVWEMWFELRGHNALAASAVPAEEKSGSFSWLAAWPPSVEFQQCSVITHPYKIFIGRHAGDGLG